MAEQSLTYKMDFDELIFAQKNKEYGAYVLRKAYKKYLTYAMWIAIIAVAIAVLAPTIYRLLNPPEDISARRRVVQITELAAPPSIGEEKKVEVVEAPPPLKSTIAFLPPVVRPDEEVTDEYIPTVEELHNVDPGASTQQGMEGGIDYSLIEVEEKVVEEKKTEEAPTYFVAVEEMPEPIGGIQAIQSKIIYPEIAKRAGVEGRVYILAFVNEAGDVTKAQVIRGLGAGLDEAALDAVKQTKFKPGKQRGKPVKVQVSIPIVFKLQ